MVNLYSIYQGHILFQKDTYGGGRNPFRTTWETITFVGIQLQGNRIIPRLLKCALWIWSTHKMVGVRADFRKTSRGQWNRRPEIKIQLAGKGIPYGGLMGVYVTSVIIVIVIVIISTVVTLLGLIQLRGFVGFLMQGRSRFLEWTRVILSRRGVIKLG